MRLARETKIKLVSSTQTLGKSIFRRVWVPETGIKQHRSLQCSGSRTETTPALPFTPAVMETLQPYLQRLGDVWNSDARKWVVYFRSPLDCWNENPTYLGLGLVFYIWALLSFRHGEAEMYWVVTYVLPVEAFTNEIKNFDR